MGPKKQLPMGLRQSQRCSGRDIALLKSYIGQENINGYLAAMLQQDGLLDFFNVETDNTSECTSTFANSDYFAVSVKSADGEYFYDLQGQQVPRKVYFKLKQNPATGAISIDQKTYTFDMPEELKDKVPCIVNPETGKTCMQGKPPPSERGRGRPAKAPSGSEADPSSSGAAPSGGRAGASARVRAAIAASRAATSGSEPGPSGSDTVQITPEELAGAVQKLQIDPRPVSITGDKPVKLTREEVDSMKDEEVLIDWMIQNVKPQDLLSCIRSGSLTPQETAQLSELEQELKGAVRPSEVPSEITPELAQAAEVISDLPPKQAENILKRLSKDDIMARLNATPPELRTQAVVDLCSRFNILPKQNKKGKIVGFEDSLENIYNVDDALDFCAGREAIRLKTQLEIAKKYITKGMLRRRARRASAPQPAPPPTPRPPKPRPQPAGLSKAELIAEINSLPDQKQKVDRLTEILKGKLPGFVKVLKFKKEILVVVKGRDEEDEEDQETISLEEAIDLLPNTVAFGKRRRVCRKTRSVQNNFKCAAKKCKGSANYRACMKKTLKSMYRKRGSKFGASPAKRLRLDDGILPFGRRRRVCRKTSSVVANFKCAAKKCKGTSDYRKCMKTTLRSIYRKRKPCAKRKPVKRCAKRKPVKRTVKRKPVKRTVRRKMCTKRKAPRCSASRLKIGTTRKGLDGNRWVVRKTKSGVKRWVKK
jgi:hypothetical protein